MLLFSHNKGTDIKEGDELGIETIRERLETDKKLIKQSLSLYGIPKILLRNSIPIKKAKDFVDDYEITPEYIFERDKKIIEERQRLTDELNKFGGVSVLPSDSNFIFVKFEDKAKTLQFVWDLREMKIIVRHFSKPGLYNYIRVTIGTSEDNNKFIEAFTKIAKKYL